MDIHYIQNLFKKYPYIIGGICVWVVVGGLIFFSSNTIPEKKHRIEELKQQLEIYDSNTQASKTLKEDTLLFKNISETIASKLINLKDTTRIFSYFLALEGKANVVMKDPVPMGIIPMNNTQEKSKIDPFIKTVISKYQLNMKGSLAAICQYMKDIESMDQKNYYSRITEMNLQRDVSDKTGNTLEAQLLIYILGRDV